MTYSTMGRGLRTALLAGIFAAGFLAGSLSQRNADAQLKDLGQAVVEQATGSGGALGTVAKLGTTIAEMQQNVDHLQQNINTLNQIKSALGGK